MISEENGQRKDTLIEFVDHITKIYWIANESGVLAMHFMNNKKGQKSWAGKSKDYLDSHSYDSARRIGTELEREILDIYVIGKCDQKKTPSSLNCN